jgi:pimeloyl-ACP methyl ester carboxylesterase
MSIFIKTVLRMFYLLLLVVGLCFLVLAVVLIILSPGKPEPILNNKRELLQGSVSEKAFASINGVRQGMIIKGKDIKNPVLLYIHGGPAFPNYFLIDKYKPGLEDIFTVCYWEQRGGGISYSKEVTIESMNLQQFAADAIEVTKYLCKRFGKDRIYMMAHSGGTPFAIMAAAKAPQLYNAYIGMAQITRQSESEKIAYKYMLDRYIANGDTRKISEFKKYPVLDSSGYIVPFYKSLLRDESMHALGIGTMRNMKSVFRDVFIPVWTCRAYTLREKINIWISKFSFLKKTKLIDELFAADIPSEIPKLEIPVYFFSGKYDLTVNHDLCKAYLEKLDAPVKGFYTFNKSAHSPIFEEPQKLKEILINDVLKGTTNFADLKLISR